MTDAGIVSAAIVLSSGLICASFIARRCDRGEWVEARRQLAVTERAVVALSEFNHQFLHELLAREQACIAREQGLDHMESA